MQNIARQDSLVKHNVHIKDQNRSKTSGKREYEEGLRRGDRGVLRWNPGAQSGPPPTIAGAIAPACEGQPQAAGHNCAGVPRGIRPLAIAHVRVDTKNQADEYRFHRHTVLPVGV